MAKVSMRTANPRKKSRFDLSSTHITTMDFGKLVPTNIIDCVPGDNMKINYKMFSRMSPLVVPTFGSFQMRTRSFFVPYRLLTDSFENFMSQAKDISLPSELPWVGNTQLIDYFTIGASHESSIGAQDWTAEVGNIGTHGLAQLVGLDGYKGAYDFGASFFVQPNAELVASKNSSVTSSTLTVGYFNFTDKGRHLFQVLQSLGYSINWNRSDKTQFSLLPLLAYARVMYDWIYPSQYVQQQGFGSLFKSETWHQGTLNGSDPYDLYTMIGSGSSQSAVIEELDRLFVNLEYICEVFFSPADRDFFTNAWFSPNSVGSEEFGTLEYSTDFTKPLSASDGGVSVYSRPFGVGMNSLNFDKSVPGEPQASGINSATSLAHRMMTRLSDFMLRNNIGGTRFLEFMKSHFGYTTQKQRMLYSTFLHSWVDEMNVQDVTATTGVEGQQLLGEMAGKGFISGSDGFSFDCDEHGLLIFISSIVPRTGYYQGRKPWTQHRKVNTDFYMPEFDSLGFEPIPNDALCADYNVGGISNTNGQNFPIPNGIFGYAPFYAHKYKHGNDFLTGDFRLGSRDNGLDSYHSFRRLAWQDNNSRFTYPKLDAEFLSIKPHEYDRIFALDPTRESVSYDHFMVIFRYGVDAHRDMLSISDSMPFFEEEGRETTVEYGGNSL